VIADLNAQIAKAAGQSRRFYSLTSNPRAARVVQPGRLTVPQPVTEGTEDPKKYRRLASWRGLGD